MSHPATLSAADGGRVLTLSVREVRLIVDRILLTLDVPSGLVPSLRDTILASQHLGKAGFLGLHDESRLAALRDSVGRLGQVRCRDEHEVLHLDAAGMHAWLVLPTWCDLLVDAARRRRVLRSRLTNVQEASELAVLAVLAARHGVAVDLSVEDGAAGARVTADTPPADSLAQRDPLLWQAIKQGYAVHESAWWPLYHASKRALSPDSVASRRHAGPTLVLDDGTIVGRAPADDDTDIALLRRVD
ncbi:hypothetical protein [Bordetella genomosp. 13]|uniref:Uncharacterized protein n=1 Tax=Bordetella genomosp. 13 TaxID=463040 RepID=A0A1W6ZAE6_9BORD|nr:hypothetical protein [Bordetella genomosp. 13]ARP94130.1 hypothetical protein CAL15_06865 [Bordetella genomosp. 13]